MTVSSFKTGFDGVNFLAGNIAYIPAIRAVFGGGYTGAAVSNVIDYINIASAGNATDFGDLTYARTLSACGSSTRGLFGSGFTGFNVIDYVTIASTGNATDFGDLSIARTDLTSCSNSTRGIWAGGYTDPPEVFHNTIDYVTIASTGNATDFGDLTSGRVLRADSCSSTTRGVFVGGDNSSGTRRTIDYVTIATTGNATSFGQLGTDTHGLPGRSGVSCASNNTRGILMGGFGDSIGIVTTTDYITIASTGDSVFFGNLTQARSQGASTASTTRATMAGGRTSSSVNTIDYFIIATTGNATDFGDLTVARYVSGGTSDSHGGL
jgi:hypothetical protein